ncbi:cellulase family glycosylhydrolase [Chitinispirillales bacterium ANBcel5]|uniref:cellulase family glycosylhydrolase n=1 Tax=Cellulosispirillum alkaliphilum TaxID=3039283 RepID=UPI002A4FA06C|nr:cellulase family glycosylhydrolase [Chitinispirillales bacterium ANBcel5]
MRVVNLKFLVLSLIIALSSAFAQENPVDVHGHLRVDDNKIIGMNHGRPAQLRGMSLYWSLGHWGSGDAYYNENVVNTLVNDWKITVIRAAIAARTTSGRVGIASDNPSDREYQLNLARAVIDAAIANNVYVVVDFHAYDTQAQNVSEIESYAIDFFTTIAQEYGDKPNVIFEILNEPIRSNQGRDAQGYWDHELKPYHENVIAAIRQHSDNLVLVGTPEWCQRVDVAAQNPLDDHNVAYVLHFYAGTHGSSLRTSAWSATLNARIPLFVSEWGTTHANGGRPDPDNDYHNPQVYIEETRRWFDWMDNLHISWCNWSVQNLGELSAILNSGGAEGGWSVSQLSESGRFIRETLRDYSQNWELPAGPDTVFHDPQVFDIPGRIQAQNYTEMDGIRVEDTEDESGDKNIANINNGNWAEYEISVNEAGNYKVDIRAATEVAGWVDFSIGNDTLGEVRIIRTGGYQDWDIFSTTLELPAGNHMLRLDFRGIASGLYNINWIDIKPSTSVLRTRNVNQTKVNVAVSGGELNLTLPQSHQFTGYELLRPNGRVVSSGSLNKTNLRINNLAKGLWFIRLNGPAKSEVFSAVIDR